MLDPLSFREIGEQLFLSPHTVKTQAGSIYRKLGVSSLAAPRSNRPDNQPPHALIRPASRPFHAVSTMPGILPGGRCRRAAAFGPERRAMARYQEVLGTSRSTTVA